MSFASETDTGRAFLVRLRKGAEDAPLFLFGGIGADPNELAGVASRTRNLKAMIGVDFCTRDNDGQFPTSVAIMAKRSCLAIRALQPRGPYHMVGYSFGGLIAIEVARLLREAGEEIALLGLIDTRYDSRHWPTGIFLRSQARLIRHHLAILLRSPPSSAIPTLSYRARRLVTRFFGRQMPSSLIPAASKTRLTSAEQHCFIAMRNYRPGHYTGKITLFDAENDADAPEFGCAPVELWRKIASEIECRIIPSTHLSIVRDDTSMSNLAAALDRCLDDLNPATGATQALGHAPRVLLVTAYRWLTTTRLALALSEAGLTVEALCPAGHSLARVKFVSATYHYSALRPISSLRDAIEASKPDLIIPGDDHITSQLHALYTRSNAIDASSDRLRTLIARSLGPPEQYPVFYARDQIAALGHAAGVLCPTVTSIHNEEELLTQLDSIGLPAVLKTDGSSGGRGVVIVHSRADAKRAFQKLVAYFNIIRALKHVMIDRDANLILPSLRRARARVSIQPFVNGRAANAAVACWEGEVLAHVCVEVLASQGATGAARVVRVISHPGMSQAVERMTRALRLSGLCGFDFILDSSDGSAHLIEFNPRATQTCHLVSADGEQLLVSLAAKLQGLHGVDSRRRPECGPIVIFPHGFACDPKDPYLQYAYSDLPRNSPELIKLGVEFGYKKNRFFAETIRQAYEKILFGRRQTPLKEQFSELEQAPKDFAIAGAAACA